MTVRTETVAGEAPTDLISKKEAAALLCAGVRTVDRYRAEGRLTSWGICPIGRTGPRVLVSRAEVEAILAEALQPRRVPGPTWASAAVQAGQRD